MLATEPRSRSLCDRAQPEYGFTAAATVSSSSSPADPGTAPVTPSTPRTRAGSPGGSGAGAGPPVPPRDQRGPPALRPLAGPGRPADLDGAPLLGPVEDG